MINHPSTKTLLLLNPENIRLMTIMYIVQVATTAVKLQVPISYATALWPVIIPKYQRSPCINQARLDWISTPKLASKTILHRTILQKTVLMMYLLPRCCSISVISLMVTQLPYDQKTISQICRNTTTSVH
jgi:hypothetical protein